MGSESSEANTRIESNVLEVLNKGVQEECDFKIREFKKEEDEEDGKKLLYILQIVLIVQIVVLLLLIIKKRTSK